MANDDVKSIGQLANLPIGELIRSVALGIAEAQTKLDESSMAVAELMSGTRVGLDGKQMDSRVYFGYTLERQEDGRVVRKPERLSMIELGFTPTFYQFVDTIIEIKVAVSITRVQRSGAPDPDDVDSGKAEAGTAWAAAPDPGYTIATTPVDASYSSSYNFSAEFTSVVKTKLVPIPPPALLEERIQLMLRRQRAGLPPPDSTGVSDSQSPQSSPPASSGSAGQASADQPKGLTQSAGTSTGTQSTTASTTSNQSASTTTVSQDTTQSTISTSTSQVSGAESQSSDHSTSISSQASTTGSGGTTQTSTATSVARAAKSESSTTQDTTTQGSSTSNAIRQNQITRVRVEVSNRTPRELGLEIRTKDDNKPITTKSLSVITKPGKPDVTANSLAEMLNAEIPKIARATVVSDNDQYFVDIEFLNQVAYVVVQDPTGGTTNRFLIDDPPYSSISSSTTTTTTSTTSTTTSTASSSKGQTQITRVRVQVSKRTPRDLGLEIRTKSDDKPVSKKELSIITKPNKPGATAESLANMLNVEIPRVARATAKMENDEHYVDIEFLKPLEYVVVQEPSGGNTNLFEVEEKPRREAVPAS